MENKEKKKEFVAKQNEKFVQASCELKRIMIAQDVLDQLKAKKMIANAGNYIKVNILNDELGHHRDLDDYTNKFKGKELQEVIQEEHIQCSVCGIGACFTSLINLNDNYTLTEDRIYMLSRTTSSQNEIHRVLLDYFSKAQMLLIETAFEANDLAHSIREDCTNLNDREITEKAINFGKKYKTDNNRLKAIMTNIIKNQGTFLL